MRTDLLARSSLMHIGIAHAQTGMQLANSIGTADSPDVALTHANDPASATQQKPVHIDKHLAVNGRLFSVGSRGRRLMSSLASSSEYGAVLHMGHVFPGILIHGSMHCL